MSLFDEKTAEQLRKVLEGLAGEVNIAVFTQNFECRDCSDNRAFVEEITSFSDKLKMQIFDFEADSDTVKALKIDKIPAIALLDSRKNDTGIRFYGVPGGYEINSFLASLLEVSGTKEALPPDVISRISAIASEIHIQVFVTLGCPYCPGAVIAAHRLALESSYVRADMIESSTFPHLANRYSVTGVPKIIINETGELTGAQPVTAFLDIIEKL